MVNIFCYAPSPPDRVQWFTSNDAVHWDKLFDLPAILPEVIRQNGKPVPSYHKFKRWTLWSSKGLSLYLDLVQGIEGNIRGNRKSLQNHETKTTKVLNSC